MAVRRTAFVLAPLALLAVTACEKPAPQVTASTEGRVVNLEASRYCYDSDECDTHTPESKEIRVRSGGQVSINVPTRVAKHGWYIPQLAQNPQSIKVFDTLHYTLDFPNIPPATDPEKPTEIDIDLIQGKPGEQPEGTWALHFVVKE